MKIHKAIIVDDHQIFRNGLKLLLNEISNIKVVGEASNGKELIDIIDSIVPDIIFMDIKMPELNGIDTTRIVIEKYPEIRIIVLSMYGTEEHFKHMIGAGACAYLLKNSDKTEIERAINVVTEGKNYFSESLVKDLLHKNYFLSQEEKVPFENPDNLTPREIGVLQYICKGLANHEIAKELNISPRTVDGHRANILDKTGAKNSVSMVIYAIKKGYIDINEVSGTR